METPTAGTTPPPLDADSATGLTPSAPSLARHAVRLFGTFAVAGPDGSDVTPPARKARALLAYLLLTRGENMPRDRLAALFWSERGDDQARASLRQTLQDLRVLSVGAAPLLVLERSQVRIVPGSVLTDVDQLRGLESSSDAVSAAALVGEQPRELLMDFDGVDPAFDDWLAVERVQRRDERRRILVAVAVSAWASGDAAGTLRLADCLLAADAFDEAAARLSMQASQALGDRDGVRLVFGRLEAALRRDLGTVPSEETRSLHQRLMAAAPSVAAAPLGTAPSALRAAPAAPRPVPMSSPTPFANNVRRPTTTAVCTAAAALVLLIGGFAMVWQRHRDAAMSAHRAMSVQPLQVAATDNAAQALKVGLSSDLARVMVSGDAAFDVVDATQPRRQSAEPPDFSITGEAHSSEGVLHANVQLRSEQAGEILWSHSFERPTGETDALREQMAAKVVDVTVCALGGHNPTLDELGVETMRLYLGGCEHKHDDWVLSAKLLRQVTERAPRFAHAWAMYAAATAVSANEVPEGVAGQMRQDALTAAVHALALDPHDGEAYFAQAEALPGMHDWQRRRRLLDAGHAVEPSNGVVLSEMARDLSMVGRWREAIAQTRRAIDADPFSPGKVAQLARLLGDSGEAFRAHDILDAAEKRYPAHRWLSKAGFLVDAYAGDAERAVGTLEAPNAGFKMRAGVPPWKTFLEARLEPTPAHMDAAMRSIAALKSQPGQSPYDLIAKMVVLGRVDDAYAYALSLSPEQADDDSINALFWAVTAPLRADPRFMTLAARFGLVAIWQQTDRWPDFCGDRSVSYNCRIEAKRAAASVAVR